MNFSHLPKAALISSPTPLEAAPNLSKQLGGPMIYLKRDDLTSVGLGGNKVRKLEYLLGEALAQGCNTAITTAALHSNFLRVFAAACNRCGIRPVVFMRGKPEEPTGNYLCTMLFGAQLHYVNTDDPYSDHTLAAMRAYADAELEKGNQAYLIHLGTFSGPLAAVGYISGAAELFQQTQIQKFEPDAIYTPVGSGGTYAGLLAGKMLLRKKTAVIGVSVNVDRTTLTRNIHDMIEQAVGLVEENIKISLSDVSVTDDFVHPGYGMVSDKGVEAIRIMAEAEGLLLDPVYTGKALAVLIRDVREGRYTKDQNVVFLYTGGMPNIFTHGHELVKRLRGY